MVKIGIGVLIFNDKKILLGKRKNSHGTGTWAPPGGHLEFGETIEACAVRETLEETGLEIQNIKLGPYTQDIFLQENKHYITIFVLAESSAIDAKVLEPNKCEAWNWFDLNNLPKPLFLSLENLIQNNLLQNL